MNNNSAPSTSRRSSSQQHNYPVSRHSLGQFRTGHHPQFDRPAHPPQVATQLFLPTPGNLGFRQVHPSAPCGPYHQQQTSRSMPPARDRQQSSMLLPPPPQQQLQSSAPPPSQQGTSTNSSKQGAGKPASRSKLSADAPEFVSQCQRARRGAIPPTPPPSAVSQPQPFPQPFQQPVRQPQQQRGTTQILRPIISPIRQQWQRAGISHSVPPPAPPRQPGRNNVLEAGWQNQPAFRCYNYNSGTMQVPGALPPPSAVSQPQPCHQPSQFQQAFPQPVPPSAPPLPGWNNVHNGNLDAGLCRNFRFQRSQIHPAFGGYTFDNSGTMQFPGNCGRMMQPQPVSEQYPRQMMHRFGTQQPRDQQQNSNSARPHSQGDQSPQKISQTRGHDDDTKDDTRSAQGFEVDPAATSSRGVVSLGAAASGPANCTPALMPPNIKPDQLVGSIRNLAHSLTRPNNKTATVACFQNAYELILAYIDCNWVNGVQLRQKIRKYPETVQKELLKRLGRLGQSIVLKMLVGGRPLKIIKSGASSDPHKIRGPHNTSGPASCSIIPRGHIHRVSCNSSKLDQVICIRAIDQVI